jgi:hypothetical protein
MLWLAVLWFAAGGGVVSGWLYCVKRREWDFPASAAGAFVVPLAFF